MIRIALPPTAWLCVLCLLPCLPAQTTLSSVQRRFGDEARRLQAASPTPEQRAELLDRQVAELQQFLGKEAAGDDRWNGRLMLADLQLARGDRAAAATALKSIEPPQAPPMVLVTAAAMAQHLNLKDQRKEWIEAALAKKASLPDRLAMARMLMTVLQEVKQGEAVFDDAVKAAADDEERAFVRWHRADALRDREDLPENTAFDELEKLKNDLPNTYWGDVAKDRLRATRLRPGDDPIPFKAKTRSGAEFALADCKGKTVVLAFWSFADRDTPTLVTTLKQLQSKFASGVVVVGICLDHDDAAIGKAVADLGIDFPVIGSGKGIQTDAALRWFVEGAAIHVIDPQGKVRGLGMHVGTADARAELQELVERAGKS
ncbi:MAG TPA: redoxin domain-containing protein [Planctomycetota bacterium]|nr:redoxin domain-containing protein [Planctomycetota bacterium]